MYALALSFLVSSANPQVAQHWYDGSAELAGYQLTQPRYGEKRTGAVVLITVTEPFSESDRVKAENPNRPKSDVFPVIKANVVKDFQTGIYDYNVMTSVFASMEPRKGERAGAPTKITFSMQEWCGMVFEELLFDDSAIRHKRFSYFDGEGATAGSLKRPATGVTVDELWLLARNLPAPFVAPGQTVKAPILPPLDFVRMSHSELAWTAGRFSRDAKTQSITVPGGTFTVRRFTASLGGNREYTYMVEEAFPHRIIAFTAPGGERGELTGVARRKYWNENREGHEKLLSSLGLKPVGGLRTR